MKPDLSAPGVAVFSAVPGGYVSANGTSMAAPHVNRGRVETLLVLGAVDLGVPGPDDVFGNGRLDLFVSAQILLGGLDRSVARSPPPTPSRTRRAPPRPRSR